MEFIIKNTLTISLLRVWSVFQCFEWNFKLRYFPFYLEKIAVYLFIWSFNFLFFSLYTWFFCSIRVFFPFVDKKNGSYSIRLNFTTLKLFSTDWKICSFYFYLIYFCKKGIRVSKNRQFILSKKLFVPFYFSRSHILQHNYLSKS